MADPSVLRLWYNNYYFITGTSGYAAGTTRYHNNPATDSDPIDLAIIGTQPATVVIYVTTDFYHFSPFMTAFDETTRDRQTITLESRQYTDLKSPHLYSYTGGNSVRWVYLTFPAVELTCGTTSSAETLFDNSSIFLVRMSESDFLAWFGRNWLSGTGARFTGPGGGAEPSWYGYQNGTHRFDGGGPPSDTNDHQVPAAGSRRCLMGDLNGQLEWNQVTPDPCTPVSGIRGRGWRRRGRSGILWMADGPRVLCDPKASEHGGPAEWMIYDCATADLDYWYAAAASGC